MGATAEWQSLKRWAQVGEVPVGEGREVCGERANGGGVQPGRRVPAVLDAPAYGGIATLGMPGGRDTVTVQWHAWRFCVHDGLWADNPRSNLKTPTFEVPASRRRVDSGACPGPAAADSTLSAQTSGRTDLDSQ